MGIRFKKIAKDFLLNMSRTFLVILAIFLGVFGTGMLLNLLSITQREMDNSYMETNPSSFSIRVSGYDNELIANLSAMEGIEMVEARRTVRARTEVAANVWLTSYLFAIDDFESVRIDKFNHVEGAALPGFGKVLFEQEALSVADVTQGDTLNVKISLNDPQELQVTGVVHAPGLKPAWMESVVYGYISKETLDMLGIPAENNDLLFVVSDEIRFDKEGISETAFTVRDWLEESGYTVNRVTIPTPGKHPNGDQTNALLFLFQLFGVMSLILSGVLVANLISSLLSGQTRQIAIMKAIGARRGQIAGMYYAMVLILGTISLVLAMPLAVMVGKALVNVCAGMLNFTVASYNIPWWSYALQICAGLLIPALAATYPIVKGTKATVNEALRDYGVSNKQFDSTRFDKWIGRIKVVKRPVLLSVRNAFRRLGRLLLTVSTLAVGGAILIVALNVNASLSNTVDKAMEALNYDLQYYFSKSYPEDEIIEAAGGVPGISKIECMAGAMATVAYEDGTENNPFQLVAPHYDAETLNLPVIEGRWLNSDDTNAVVLNHKFADSGSDVRIGDTITLKVNGILPELVVVGIVKEVGGNEKAYVNYDYYQKISGGDGYARMINVVTDERTSETQDTVSVLIEETLKKAGLDVMLKSSFSDVQKVFDNHIGIIAAFLVLASVLVIVVGIMGLVSSMSMSVMERMREIGVMRATGAKTSDILLIIIFEGILTGLFSWITACVLAIPFTYVVGNTFGGIFLQTPLDNVLNPWGFIIWLAVILIITTLAGLGTAFKALDLPVNEVLTYE